MTDAQEQLTAHAARVSAVRNKVANSLAGVGLSAEMIAGYQAMVSDRAGKFIAEFLRRVNGQAIHDALTNLPSGIIAGLGDKRAETIVNEAAIHALASMIKWDCQDARELAVELLHDVNDHGAAAALASWKENGL